MKIKYFIVLSLIFFSCNDIKRSSSQELNVIKLKQEIINSKDNESYGVILDLNANDSLNYESLSFSLLMADEDNAHANLMVFTEIIRVFNNNKFSLKKFEELNQKNRDFAFYHLCKAASLEHISGQIYLEEIYRKGIGVEENQMLADSILTILSNKKGYKRIDIID
jgi:hypothetical protein